MYRIPQWISTVSVIKRIKQTITRKAGKQYEAYNHNERDLELDQKRCFNIYEKRQFPTTGIGIINISVSYQLNRYSYP